MKKADPSSCHNEVWSEHVDVCYLGVELWDEKKRILSLMMYGHM